MPPAAQPDDEPNRAAGRTLAAAAAVALLLVAGCGTSKHAYPQAAVDSYVGQCVSTLTGAGAPATRAAAACSCSIEKVEASMSYESYAAAMAAARHGTVDRRIRSAVESCAATS